MPGLRTRIANFSARNGFGLEHKSRPGPIGPAEPRPDLLISGSVELVIEENPVQAKQTTSVLQYELPFDISELN